MRILQPSPQQLASAAALRSPVATGLSTSEVLAEMAAGRLRSEWAVVALSDSDTVVGRAMWWGRDATAPIALDVWDVEEEMPNRDSLAKALLDAGHETLGSRGVPVPLPHTMRLPNAWRDHPAAVAEADLKVRIGAAAGLTRVNERLQFQWETGRPLPSEPGSLIFTPADDDTFVRLFAAAAEGSLDVMTRRELESSSAHELARSEVDFYLACPGDRSWWRTAATADGTVVGVAIPSATPSNRNVGYLAVLPEHRGRGYVDGILAFITRFHAKEGASRITATTDAVNAPMAAAFHRAGYLCTETRIDLEAP